MTSAQERGGFPISVFKVHRAVMISNNISNRQIRIFISSTFQDMQAECDYLMTKTFPRLRALAQERNVSLVEVDLRWGITKEEEGQSGKVVFTCLNEIEQSHPFFIGILGNRYGWCPEEKDLMSKRSFVNVMAGLREISAIDLA